MTAAWKQSEREAAYTALCEAVTAAGPARETQLLARLCLLLAEELADSEAFQRALEGAKTDRRGPVQTMPATAP